MARLPLRRSGSWEPFRPLSIVERDLIGHSLGPCAHFSLAGLLTMVEIPFDPVSQTFVSQTGGHFANAGRHSCVRHGFGIEPMAYMA